MGAWSLTAGLVLLVVILHNIQILEAVPKGNSSHGMQRMVFPDFRQFTPEEQEESNRIADKLFGCAAKWLASATFGRPCISRSEIKSKYIQLGKTYQGQAAGVPPAELEKVTIQNCQETLKCSPAGKCECEGSSVDSSPCGQPRNGQQDFLKNCEQEFAAFLDFLKRILPKIEEELKKRQNGNSVRDPGQNSQYMILMAVILSFVAAN